MPQPTPTPQDPAADPGCCGNGRPESPKAGSPRVHACQLCPASPTYWRKTSTTAAAESAS